MRHNETAMEVTGNNARLRIYLGEDKRHDGRPLYEAIVQKARQLQLAGATVVRGSQGYGRSTRLHTTEVVFSEDLPVVIEIIDRVENIRKFAALLDEIDEIGLVTCDEVSVLRYRSIAG
jgi:uncharacterized protein